MALVAWTTETDVLKSKVKVLAGLVSAEASLQPLCGLFSVPARTSLVPLPFLGHQSYYRAIPLSLLFWAYDFYLNYLLESPFAKYSKVLEVRFLT